MVLALRRKVNIKVRQPLQCIMIPAVDDVQKRHIEAVKGLIENEVNVKELKFVEGSDVLVKKVKCNFRTMGKKFGKLMKSIAAKMDALAQADIAAFEKAGQMSRLNSLMLKSSTRTFRDGSCQMTATLLWLSRLNSMTSCAMREWRAN